ncbi:MAG: PocR ligand-binding domain-containing protein [Candidatus Omnitrophica bacterium]|nr:PocR ligand-binding domain-containing protein [Candidatus Omnitrophota bacterium]
MYRNGLDLNNLVNLDEWQWIQDSFSEIVGVTLCTIDPDGKKLTRISGPSGLCSNTCPNPSKKSVHCGDCLPDFHNKLDVKEEANFKCVFGLDLFVLPIRIFGSRVAAYICIGPVILNKRKEESVYEKEAIKAGLKPEELIDALIEINVFSYNRIRAVIKLLRHVFARMVQTEYHKRRLGEIGRDVVEIDPLFSKVYEEKILSSLLNTCIIALEADSGSVMTVDKATRELHIKAASKLDERIVNNANVKMGEGIAGVAAAMAEPIILPKDRNKNGLANKMMRKYIKASMIVPFNKADDQDVYGVINLNMVRKEKEFSKRDIALIKKLVNFASVALAPVK